jgi:hypothetical protein
LTADWTLVTDLGSWKGSSEGCLDGYDVNNIQVGDCTGNSIATGTEISARGPAVLNRWRSQPKVILPGTGTTNAGSVYVEDPAATGSTLSARAQERMFCVLTTSASYW